MRITHFQPRAISVSCFLTDSMSQIETPPLASPTAIRLPSGLQDILLMGERSLGSVNRGFFALTSIIVSASAVASPASQCPSVFWPALFPFGLALQDQVDGPGSPIDTESLCGFSGHHDQSIARPACSYLWADRRTVFPLRRKKAPLRRRAAFPFARRSICRTICGLGLCRPVASVSSPGTTS